MAAARGPRLSRRRSNFFLATATRAGLRSAAPSERQTRLSSRQRVKAAPAIEKIVDGPSGIIMLAADRSRFRDQRRAASTSHGAPQAAAQAICVVQKGRPKLGQFCCPVFLHSGLEHPVD